SRGRYPHQSFLRQWSRTDEEVVAHAMDSTGITALADRSVDELSGGQRQRVWLAMVLAQQTPLLLLDEPTTYLDIAHQMDILSHATRYATHLIVMKHGTIVAEGDPTTVITSELVEDVFGLPVRVIPDPETNTPMIVPLDRRSAGRYT